MGYSKSLLYQFLFSNHYSEEHATISLTEKEWVSLPQIKILIKLMM